MTQEQRSEIARKGGLAVAKRKGYMSKIGRNGGLMTCHNRLHRLREAEKAAKKRQRKAA